MSKVGPDIWDFHVPGSRVTEFQSAIAKRVEVNETFVVRDLNLISPDKNLETIGTMRCVIFCGQKGAV